MAAIFSEPWSDDYYTIEKLDVFPDHLKDQTTFRVAFCKNFLLPNDSAAQCGYVRVFNNEVLHNLGEKQVMHLLAEGASKDLEYPQEFMTAMAKWYGNTQNWIPLGYTDNMHFEYKYDNGGFLDGGSAAITAKNVSVSEVSPINMDDVNILPGITEVVKHPQSQENCSNYGHARIKDMIMHLNDGHRWTREQIADWLETLDVDLTFKSSEARLADEKQKRLSDKYKALAAQQELIKMFKSKLWAAETQIKTIECEIKKLEEEVNE